MAEISDDIRRRLDQRNLWDVIVDDEADKPPTKSPTKFSAKAPNKSPAKLPKEVVEPKQNKSQPAIRKDAVENEVQEKKALEQPISKKIVEEIVPQLEAQEPTVQQPTEPQSIVQQLEVQEPAMHQPIMLQPQVQQLQITKRIVQQPKVPELISQQRETSQKAQPTLVHQSITQQSQVHPPPIMEPPIVQQEVQLSQDNLQSPKMNQPIVNQHNISKMSPISNTEKQPEKNFARDLGMHDYLFGTTLRNHAGNRKYHEVASTKMTLYQSAKPSEKAGIAASVVNEWRALDPSGQFLKYDNERACFVDVGNDKAIAKTKKILRAKLASPTKTNIGGIADSVSGRESTSVSPLDVSVANLKRSEDNTSNTNAIIASIAQMAEEKLEKETEATQKQVKTKEKRKIQKILRPVLKLVMGLVILSIAVISYYAPSHNRKRCIEILFIPAAVVLTLFLALWLTTAYSSFTLTAATITGRRVTRQVRLFPRVFLLPFLVSVLIFASVSLYLQPKRIMTVLLMPQVALLTLSPILLLLSFALAMIVTHEAPHHHVEGGFFREVCTLAEDTLRRQRYPSTTEEGETLPTLRDYLSHPEGFHMAFAPAFFGFFAYFGALAALEEGTGLIVPPITEKRKENEDESIGLRSVSGASAGAMAATLLSCGIDPSLAAEFTSKFTWGMVADPPGIGGYVKGNRFEEAMVNFLLNEASKVNRADRPSDSPLQFDEALIPCAVSGFDLLHMKSVILSSGSMAKAVRASAGFPVLFQPVAWRENNDEKKWLPDSLLIDGGIRDGLGLAGLGAISSSEKKRVVNVVVGDFGFSGPSGINSLPKGVNASSLVSISIVGTPMCGPWAMENGKRA